ncbi:MAG: PadR family transcriptional regulator [Pseudomonadota bacterium]
MARSNPPFMTGVPELLVLRLLADSEMYGYEIVRKIRLVTGEAIRIGEGVVYPALHSLEKAGALASRRRQVDGRQRVYYSLTAAGRRRLEDLTGEWDRIQQGVNTALQPSHA